MAFCGKCGTEAVEGNSFCTFCGSKLESTVEAKKEHTPRDTEPSPAPESITTSEDDGVSLSEVFSKRFLAFLFMLVALAGGTWWAISLAGDVESPYLKETAQAATKAPESQAKPSQIDGWDCNWIFSQLSVVDQRIAESDVVATQVGLDTLAQTALDYSNEYSGDAKNALQIFRREVLAVKAYLIDGTGDASVWDDLMAAYDDVYASCE